MLGVPGTGEDIFGGWWFVFLQGVSRKSVDLPWCFDGESVVRCVVKVVF